MAPASSITSLPSAVQLVERIIGAAREAAVLAKRIEHHALAELGAPRPVMRASSPLGSMASTEPT